MRPEQAGGSESLPREQAPAPVPAPVRALGLLLSDRQQCDPGGRRSGWCFVEVRTVDLLDDVEDRLRLKRGTIESLPNDAPEARLQGYVPVPLQGRFRQIAGAQSPPILSWTQNPGVC
ncbi:MAG: hypothetical protein KAY37_12270, partial [Phycisphaerae bacterium]|nr:hypothetical protein [Phycisphaerae bacterium]